jgi:hypothetical protein
LTPMIPTPSFELDIASEPALRASRRSRSGSRWLYLPIVATPQSLFAVATICSK